MPSSPVETADAEAARLAKARALVERADGLIAAGRFGRAVETARAATEQAAEIAATWDVLARALEAQGDPKAALAAYGEAASRAGDPADRDWTLAQAALGLGDYAAAERFLTAHLERTAPTQAAIAGLARAQAGQHAFDQARETLRAALETDAAQPLLWLTLGSILAVEGRHTQAVIFLEEALRLDPDSVQAKAVLADSLLQGAGDAERAVELGEEALAAAQPADRPAMTPAQARRQLAAGRLAQGWAALAAGAEPGDLQTIEVRMAAPRATPGMQLGGRLVLIGEDAVADELLLAHVIPDLIAEGLPLILAVDPSWGNLARRSFPGAMAVPRLSRAGGGRRLLAADLDSPHVHGKELVAAWAPLRAMMPSRRAAPAAFADAAAYLTPDPDRVGHWRARLAESGPGLKVGFTWRTPVVEGVRAWDAPLLSWLAGALSAPGIQLVGLEWREIFGELDVIREAYGLRIETPPDLDRDDLDDLAALSCATDIVVGPPDVATYLAAACGAETWFLSPPRHWALLGGDAYPWFPKARVFQAHACDDWNDAMVEFDQALADRARSA